jgi:hypothetical protein
MVGVRAVWLGQVFTGDPPYWWVYSAANFRRYLRALPSAAVAIVNSLIRMAALVIADPASGSGEARWMVGGLVALWPLPVVAFLFARPRRLIPPWLRP